MADSNSSSRAHTSSPSPSASTSTTQDNKPKKRTRASKPKVRTGCITWLFISKIRRVKCGEEKPACYRCTSTGRTCDGYDNGTPLRNRTPQDSLQEAELKRAEFLRTYQWNESVRSMRPIVADIEGTEMEKKFFHRFRTATEDSLTAHQMCTFTPFWTRLAPRITHHDDAVKHAAIALGAAHQLYQPPSSNSAVPDNRLTPEDIEVFIIQQYNKSISKLQRHVGSSSPESIKVTLICCLAYICLETLRSSHQAVVTHLLNGLKILQSLPPTTFDFLADPRSYPLSPREVVPTSLDGSAFEMTDIIRIFGKLECSACFFVPGIHPVVAEYGYRYRRFDDGSRETPFVDLRSAQSAIVCFTRDVVARVYQVGAVSDPFYFWADLVQQQQQACLRERSKRLETLVFNDILTRPGALPAPDTPEVLCFYTNLLHFRTAQLLLDGLDLAIPRSVPSSPSGQPYPPPPSRMDSSWQQQQQRQFQLPHHSSRPGLGPAASSSENLVFSQNLDPRLAAQTLVQMQMDTPSSLYGAGYNTSSEEILPLNHSSSSLPTTPGSIYNPTAHNPSQQQHLPFPFFVFSRPGTRPMDIATMTTTTRILHEIIRLAEMIHSSPSTKRFRDLMMRQGTGASSNNRGNITPNYVDATSPLNRNGRSYSYAFTSDTGLLGPLSLVALVSSVTGGQDEDTDTSRGKGKGKGLGYGQGQGQAVVGLRKTALGMLKEYVTLGGPVPGIGEEDVDADADVEQEETSLPPGEEEKHGPTGGDGERFWVDYFRMLGFNEVLTPGAEHFVHGQDYEYDYNYDYDYESGLV
ncbi:hypothetical protein V8F20_007424 [Naviculisporaceae sp. PSN 640]